jgi:hypothetical protein
MKVLAQAAVKFGVGVSLGWLQELAIRLLSPHLWFAHSIGHKVTIPHRAVERRFEIFQLPRSQTAEPLQYLSRLTSIT